MMKKHTFRLGALVALEEMLEHLDNGQVDSTGWVTVRVDPAMRSDLEKLHADIWAVLNSQSGSSVRGRFKRLRSILQRSRDRAARVEHELVEKVCQLCHVHPPVHPGHAACSSCEKELGHG